MNNYTSYYVDGCEKEKTSQLFLRVILSYSDAFSLIYFQHRENEALSKTASDIEKQLEPYMLFSQDVNEWPGTKTRNEQGHIYRMVVYRADLGVLPVLEQVAVLWDWDYPCFPMDPCFYKKGYAWFATSTHEHWNLLFLMDDPMFPLAPDLESIGVTLVPEKTARTSEPYYNNAIANLC